MALIGTLLSVAPNCTAATFALYPGAVDTNNDVLVKVYLIEGDVETKVYENAGDGTGGTYFQTSIYKFTVENFTDATNSLYDAGDAELDAIIEGITSLNGLFKFEFSNGEDPNVITYSLGTCSIDCCLANLIQNNLDCNCSGDDCCEDIKKAEKILILTRAAILDAANADIAGATEKYNKAVELCGATPCDCNC